MRIGTAAETPSDNPGTACVKTGHCVAVMCGTARTAADRCGPPRTRREPVRTRAYRMATGPLGGKQGSVSTQQWCLSGWQVRGRAQCCAMLRNAAQCCAMTGTRRETRANMAAPLSPGGVLKRASGAANKHRTPRTPNSCGLTPLARGRAVCVLGRGYGPAKASAASKIDRQPRTVFGVYSSARRGQGQG